MEEGSEGVGSLDAPLAGAGRGAALEALGATGRVGGELAGLLAFPDCLFEEPAEEGAGSRSSERLAARDFPGVYSSCAAVSSAMSNDTAEEGRGELEDAVATNGKVDCEGSSGEALGRPLLRGPTRVNGASVTLPGAVGDEEHDGSGLVLMASWEVGDCGGGVEGIVAVTVMRWDGNVRQIGSEKRRQKDTSFSMTG
jgi:hypothetical protein